jgi:hypothetical protein
MVQAACEGDSGSLCQKLCANSVEAAWASSVPAAVLALQLVHRMEALPTWLVQAVRKQLVRTACM